LEGFPNRRIFTRTNERKEQIRAAVERKRLETQKAFSEVITGARPERVVNGFWNRSIDPRQNWKWIVGVRKDKAFLRKCSKARVISWCRILIFASVRK